MIDRCHLGQGNQTTGITSQNRIILDLMSLTYWNRTTTQNHFLTISLARLVWPETQKIKVNFMEICTLYTKKEVFEGNLTKL